METIRRFGLHDHERGRTIPEDVRQVRRHGYRHGPHARLQENVRRANALLPHFLDGFLSHRHVTRHQALRNVDVSGPIRVLHIGPAVFRRRGLRKLHGRVVVDVGDVHHGARLSDALHAFNGTAFRHVDHRLLTEFHRRPGDAHPVIAVGRRGKGALAETPQGFGGGQNREVGTLHPELLGEKRRDAPTSAQGLESLEAEALPLVLHEDVLHAERPGERRQMHKRRRLIVGHRAVKGPHGRRGFGVVEGNVKILRIRGKGLVEKLQVGHGKSRQMSEDAKRRRDRPRMRFARRRFFIMLKTSSGLRERLPALRVSFSFPSRRLSPAPKTLSRPEDSQNPRSRTARASTPKTPHHFSQRPRPWRRSSSANLSKKAMRAGLRRIAFDTAMTL